MIGKTKSRRRKAAGVHAVLGLEDNLCFFRCLAMHLILRRGEINRPDTPKHYAKTGERGNFGVKLDGIAGLEFYFKVQDKIYTFTGVRTLLFLSGDLWGRVTGGN